MMIIGRDYHPGGNEILCTSLSAPRRRKENLV